MVGQKTKMQRKDDQLQQQQGKDGLIRFIYCITVIILLDKRTETDSCPVNISSDIHTFALRLFCWFTHMVYFTFGLLTSSLSPYGTF